MMSDVIVQRTFFPFRSRGNVGGIIKTITRNLSFSF
jgi:hypothetical protein